jgi:O-antigen ligase
MASTSDVLTPPAWRAFAYSSKLPSGTLLTLGSLCAALLVGVAAAVSPELAIAGVLGLALVPIVLVRPIVGLCGLVFISFLERYAGMTGALSLTKVLGALLVFAWLAIVTTRSANEPRALVGREPLLTAALILFTAWVAMSLVWAEAPADARTSLQRFVLNFTLFPIALLAIRTPRHMLWVVAAFILGALAAATLGIAEGTVGAEETEGRLKGAGLNPNQLGSYLVVAMVLCAALAANRRWPPIARVVLAGAAAFAGASVFLTLSRGALVGLATALILAPFVVGSRRRARTVAMVAVVVLGTVGWYAVVASDQAIERVTNPERGGGSGREDLWKVGWRMVEDKPVYGVGAGNFPVSSIHYLLRPGATQRDAFIVDEKKVAHNIYLTVVSELGVVGLLLFLLIIVVCLRSTWRAAKAFAARGDPVMELVARALLIALVSLLAVGFFSSALYVKQFWILLAAGPVLHAIAERRPSDTHAPGRAVS